MFFDVLEPTVQSFYLPKSAKALIHSEYFGRKERSNR
jgi:hypothetical protein